MPGSGASDERNRTVYALGVGLLWLWTSHTSSGWAVPGPGLEQPKDRIDTEATAPRCLPSLARGYRWDLTSALAPLQKPGASVFKRQILFAP